jgi:predicted dehydrogenase
VVNPDRLLPSRQLIRQQLDSDKLGEVGLIRVHRWEPGGSRTLAHGLPTSLWRDLDLVLWLVGQPPTQVFSLGSLVDGSIGLNGDTVQVHLGFPSGAMALIDYSNQLPDGDGYQSLTVIGSAGAAYADDHQNRQLVFRGGHAQTVRGEEFDASNEARLREFDDRLAATLDSLTGDSEWQRVVRVAEAVLQSLDSRQAVSLSEEAS